MPSSNIAAEPDFRRLMPQEVEIHSARMFLDRTTAACERVMLDEHALRAATDLGTIRPHAVAFACTSAGALLGVEGERRLEQSLGRLCSAPIISANAAVAWWLRRLGLKRVAVVTAYVEELNAGIERTLEGRGFEVVAISGFGITDNFEIGLLRPEDILDRAVRSVAGAGADCVFVSCTNLRSAEIADALADRLGVPVVTSNVAAIDRTLDQLGLPVTGVGVPIG